jgi:hypothetical protein
MWRPSSQGSSAPGAACVPREASGAGAGATATSERGAARLWPSSSAARLWRRAVLSLRSDFACGRPRVRACVRAGMRAGVRKRGGASVCECV